jgi:hypothetical protein
MAVVASQPPVRQTSGGTSDAPFQPLADCGNGNPFFYHVFADDFDTSLAVTGTYTAIGTGAANTLLAGDGGIASFSTAAGAGTFGGIQTPVGGFTVNSPPKKVFWEGRFQMANVSTMTLLAGLVAIFAAPATPTVVNGVYFSKAAGTLQLVGNVTVASATVSVNIPLGALTLVNGSYFDLAIYVTRQGDVEFYADTQLVGFVPQSNIGTTNGPNNAGAVARLTAPTLPTVPLAPTIVFGNGATAAIIAGTADFHQAQKER